jgi:hypothetical protein
MGWSSVKGIIYYITSSFSEGKTDRQNEDREIDGQTDRQTDRQIDR